MSATMPDRLAPTKCGHCGYTNGGAFSVCPCCKAPQHANDADYWEPDYERRPALSEYDELRRDDDRQRYKDWPR